MGCYLIGGGRCGNDTVGGSRFGGESCNRCGSVTQQVVAGVYGRRWE